jgi:hypothetical protein
LHKWAGKRDSFRLWLSEGSRDANYFPRMLKALSLVALTGQFTRCGGQ